MKVVINRCYGGFGLSDEAFVAYCARKCRSIIVKDKDRLFSNYEDSDGYPVHYYDIERHDEDLIAVIEEMGVEDASGDFSDLKIVEIPDGTNYEIDDYDGMETVHEVHESWC